MVVTGSGSQLEMGEGTAQAAAQFQGMTDSMYSCSSACKEAMPGCAVSRGSSSGHKAWRVVRGKSASCPHIGFTSGQWRMQGLNGCLLALVR